MVNKRGIWRIIEAVFSILIIAIAILMLVSQQSAQSRENNFSQLLRQRLNEISRDNDLRDLILKDSAVSTDAENAVRAFIYERTENSRLDFDVLICNLAEACEIDLNIENVEIFSEERLISANFDQVSPKILRVYLWQE